MSISFRKLLTTASSNPFCYHPPYHYNRRMMINVQKWDLVLLFTKDKKYLKYKNKSVTYFSCIIPINWKKNNILPNQLKNGFCWNKNPWILIWFIAKIAEIYYAAIFAFRLLNSLLSALKAWLYLVIGKRWQKIEGRYS